MKQIICWLLALMLSQPLPAQRIQPAAERFSSYLHLLKGKRVAIFANQTSVISDRIHLVDTLSKQGIHIIKIFAPEHGFRGTADAGEKVDNSIDPATGIRVISLYGKNRKATAADLADVDILVFDIQDVGCRFYTFISSLEEFMESAIQARLPLVILDRPNPNGFYVDGPVLEKPFRSFVGMQPVPVVYGMTIGEYAKMLAGEKWLDSSLHGALATFSLTVIPCGNYTHKSKYVLPVKPSPNLPDMSAIYWYPSTCFFEGTALSEGRGTDHPFQVFGHPSLPKNLFAFTPVSRDGAKDPKLKNQLCYGWDISSDPQKALAAINNRLQLKYLLQAYQLFPQKDSFFLGKPGAPPSGYFFNKLAGNASLMDQVKNGASEATIRESWQPALNRFKAIRKKYLLYPDFE
ncbi:exo-beta-N-acetylmuramidase NamZ family protein [Flavihumibacter profundi]|uniref:exo-beta-N-acetylmuramidase NamZ family protein n=1 Tax=Flavihumibacter profundi TaxID=2716883 RepID=UPI001CC3D712|nr:DUF1343 domain-containing protein [Flavihumibacter profundi]MBZ5857233.1 DUF1343 domain-containing protein [Flavihumibacter profundi]